jgi:N-acetylglucosaminyldiphosphoundecaprenol N-acetyl-beta-D-mannosaminyltransferase
MSILTARSLASQIRTTNSGPETVLAELLSNSTYVVSFVNAHAVNLACKNQEFFCALKSADILLRDGSGARLLMGAVGRDAGLNMNGTDFIPKLLLANRTLPIALYGSSSQVAAGAAEYLASHGAVKVTYSDGFRPFEDYMRQLNVDRPRILILGMGMPKQELLAQTLAKQLPWPILIVNGGAILDFMAGRFGRAPTLLRQLGLEWLYRLWLEPRRLWRRYIVGNALFMARTGVIALQYRLSTLFSADNS